MSSNLEKYKSDLDKLITEGYTLLFALCNQYTHEEFMRQAKTLFKEKKDDAIAALPHFENKYQSWYSEALVLIKFLLPDRLEDFVRHYEKPKNRKSLTYETYVIADCLQGLVIRNAIGENIVSQDAAIPHFQQQLNIVDAARERFESSLFDIKRLLQADLFDSELDAAKELNQKGFTRGAGAVAGVVLEGHLSEVCANHKITISKKNPGINDLNQLLKDNQILDIPDWRFIQHLADLRNLCDHDKKKDPTKEDIDDLITGANKIIKKIF